MSALTGLKVLEFGTMVAGPFAARGCFSYRV
jgi:crotonobetainyl-CoA:carnitine CoA-transferase CaiB-like acyl-CoA transferase